MAKPTTRQLSDRHEEFLASLVEGSRMRGSGNQFNGQTDVRNAARDTYFAMGIDGKSTLGKSITVKLEDWTKVVTQANDLIPSLALRFYHDDRLRTSTDLIMVSAEDFLELLSFYRESQA